MEKPAEMTKQEAIDLLKWLKEDILRYGWSGPKRRYPSLAANKPVRSAGKPPITSREG
jgi:hypothetical protein